MKLSDMVAGAFDGLNKQIARLTIERDNLKTENQELRDSLKKISEFGLINSGKGYSCAKMAKEAIDKTDAARAPKID
jgi:hypothetical protein